MSLQVNGVDVMYDYCSSDNMAGHFVFFPNIAERLPADAVYRDRFLGVGVFARALPTPSSRGLPESYYTSVEIHFGGCGGYRKSNDLLELGITGIAMGFR